VSDCAHATTRRNDNLAKRRGGKEARGNRLAQHRHGRVRAAERARCVQSMPIARHSVAHHRPSHVRVACTQVQRQFATSPFCHLDTLSDHHSRVCACILAGSSGCVCRRECGGHGGAQAVCCGRAAMPSRGAALCSPWRNGNGSNSHVVQGWFSHGASMTRARCAPRPGDMYVDMTYVCVTVLSRSNVALTSDRRWLSSGFVPWCVRGVAWEGRVWTGLVRELEEHAAN
jgi:hypothetical protein